MGECSSNCAFGSIFTGATYGESMVCPTPGKVNGVRRVLALLDSSIKFKWINARCISIHSAALVTVSQE